MSYEESVDGLVTRDELGVARRISHPRRTFRPAVGGNDATSLASAYLRQVGQQFTLGSVGDPRGGRQGADVTGVIPIGERPGRDVTVVSYEQVHEGIAVFRAGVAVQVRSDLSGVVGSASSLVTGIDVQRPGRGSYDDLSVEVEAGAEAMAARQLNKALGRGRSAAPDMQSPRLVIYRYRAGARTDRDPADEGQPLSSPDLDLPNVPTEIVEGGDYLAHQVVFSLTLDSWGEIEFEALVEAETVTVLWIRAGVEACTGSVFPDDPITVSGNPGHDPCAPSAVLQPLTETVTLLGLDPPAAGVQSLSGRFVTLSDTDAPAIAAPTVPSAACDFNFDPTSDDFAAVNGYHHMEGLYRMVEEMGFVNYFAGTTFPIPLDHRGENGVVNAHHHGFGSATTKFRFGLAEAGCPVGIACDRRIVIHEFAHSVLRNRIDSGTFSFAHGVGDSLAVILSDPRSQVPDRFDTFPFNSISRRHDRAVDAGWGWGGTFDTGSYSSTQILATTLFRAYRSMGGDAGELGEREFAARWMAFLVLAAVELETPLTQPNSPEDLADDLITADLSTSTFSGHPGGTFHKVIRWAFEQQDAFGGQPPDVDLFIDDSRSGQYEWLPSEDLAEPPGVWARRQPDGLAAHQDPIVESPTFVYVRIENRGTRPARRAEVSVFAGPSDPTATVPGQFSLVGTRDVAEQIAPGQSVVVGPFEWLTGDEPSASLLASVSSPEDESNVELVTGPVEVGRLVPFDNNIARRAVSVVPYPVQYSVKYVCGPSHCGSAPTVVEPGHYSTAINIQNPNDTSVRYRRRASVALPGERPGAVSAFDTVILPPYSAVEIDCPDIAGMLGIQPGCFLKGFVTIEATGELEVVAVYSAAGADGQVETIDVERVAGRRRVRPPAPPRPDPRPRPTLLPDLVPLPGFGPPPPDRPSLLPQNFCFSRTRAPLADALRIIVRNQGLGDAGPTVTRVVFAGHGSVDLPTPAVAAGAETMLEVDLPQGCVGAEKSCIFEVTVDATSLLEETNKVNNTTSGGCPGIAS